MIKMSNQKDLLVFENIVKHYPGVTALKGINMCLGSGEIVALLGENGAGKSTLVKILCGSIPYGEYQGQIQYQGDPVKFSGTRDAAERGIVMVPQEANIQMDLSVAENIVLGNWPMKGIFVDEKRMNTIAAEAMKHLDFDIDVTQKAGNTTSGVHQMICIARTLLQNPSVLILDEPTSALTKKETQILFRQVKALRDSGICCIYITHKLDEVFEIADRVVVFRDGELISEYGKESLDVSKIIRDIVGKESEKSFVRECHATDEISLSFRNISIQHPYASRKMLLENVSFDLRKGEILGLAGLLGSGRSELLKAAFGAMPKVSGELYISDKPLNIKSPEDAIANGIGLLTENRAIDGYVKTMSVGQNMTLVILKKLKRGLFLSQKKENDLINQYFKRIRIKAPSPQTPILSLSGGNQQKVLVTKWLMNSSKILLLDEPTRGVDVGAREEIYNLMSDLTKQGASIVMVSSELPEMVKICDRFVVFANGTVKEIIDADKTALNEADLMEKISGMESLAV